MAGTVAPGGVNPPAVPDPRAGTDTRFALATTADDAAIRRLLRDNHMPGFVRLTFEREPDYFHGANLAGAHDETIVAYTSRGQLVCAGRCSRRPGWLDGAPAPVGYLAELRLDAAARGRFRVVRDGYRFFAAQRPPGDATFYFTSVAADNFRARRFLERGARGMPTYHFLAELTTLLVAVPRHPRPSTRLQVSAATPDDLPTLQRLLAAHGERHQLAAVWSADTLRALPRHGLPLDHFLVAHADGTPVGCGALWDQRAFRQTVIHGYTLGGLVPAYNLLAPLFSAPRLPRPGSTLAHGFLSPLALEKPVAGLLPDFVAAFFPLARRAGLDYLTLALPATDGRLSALRRRFATRAYASRLYQVTWPGEEPPSAFPVEGHPFLPDVALL